MNRVSFHEGMGSVIPIKLPVLRNAKTTVFHFEGLRAKLALRKREKSHVRFYSISQSKWCLATGFHQKYDFHKTEFWENILNQQAGHGKAKEGGAEMSIAAKPYLPQ